MSKPQSHHSMKLMTITENFHHWNLHSSPPIPISLAGLHTQYHPSCSQSELGGQNLLQTIDELDPHATDLANSNVHYPFAGHADWQLAHWLASAPLPQSSIT